MNVRTLCLAILSFGDVTGYEIKKLAEDDGMFGYFIEASFGAIYPALARMTKEGLVTWRSEVQEGKPSRKVYSITDLGREEFIKNLSVSPKPDKFKSEFMLMMLCHSMLDKKHIKEIYDARLELQKSQIGAIKSSLCDEEIDDATQFVIGYSEHMTRSSVEYLEKNRHLIDDDK